MKRFTQSVFARHRTSPPRERRAGAPASQRPRLVIRLSEAATEIEWLIAHGAPLRVLAQGRGTPSQAREALAAYPGIRQACVLVPATEVTLHTIAIPRQARRQLQQALPFMLEDRLAVDVDAVHCAVLAWRGEQATVAVVAKTRMQSWLEACAALGIKPQPIVPDAMALPLHADGMSALRHRDLWLFRQPDGDGMAAEHGWHAALLASCWHTARQTDAAPEADEPADVQQRGYSYSLPVPEYGQWDAQPAVSLLELAAQGQALPPLGLDQGAFTPANAWRTRWDAWRSVAVLAGCYLALLLGDALWQHYQHYQQATFWRQESVRVYRQIFPAETQVVNPRVQMQRHLELAGGERDAPRLRQQMDRLQALMGENQDVRLTALAYDGARREIRLAFSTPGYPELEQFQQQAESLYQVQHGEIRQSGPRVEGHMTLRGQP